MRLQCEKLSCGAVPSPLVFFNSCCAKPNELCTGRSADSKNSEVPSMISSFVTLPRRWESTAYRLPSCDWSHCRSHL